MKRSAVKAMKAKNKDSNYDASYDVTKYCKGCTKSFKEHYRYGSGYCPKCRTEASKQYAKKMGWLK